jgi:hypothetical protein
MKDVFARCFKKMAVQVCTVIIMCLPSCNIVYSHNMLQFLHSGNLIRNIYLFIYTQLFMCSGQVHDPTSQFSSRPLFVCKFRRQGGCGLLIGVYFHRLKINHDSHEFILESSPVANRIYATEVATAIAAACGRYV